MNWELHISGLSPSIDWVYFKAYVHICIQVYTCVDAKCFSLGISFFVLTCMSPSLYYCASCLCMTTENLQLFYFISHFVSEYNLILKNVSIELDDFGSGKQLLCLVFLWLWPLQYKQEEPKT